MGCAGGVVELSGDVTSVVDALDQRRGRAGYVKAREHSARKQKDVKRAISIDNDPWDLPFLVDTGRKGSCGPRKIERGKFAVSPQKPVADFCRVDEKAYGLVPGVEEKRKGEQRPRRIEGADRIAPSDEAVDDSMGIKVEPGHVASRVDL